MKKTAIMTAMMVLSAGLCFGESFFFGSGTGASATVVVVGRGNGAISAQDVLMSVETNATATVYRGKAVGYASAASTTNTVVLTTSATNTVDGVLLTTDDSVIIGSTLYSISTLTPASGGLSTTVTLGANTSVAANQPVYVCDAGDNVSLAVRTTWGGTPIPFLFEGFNNAPAAISVPAAAGAVMVSGRAEYK